MCVEAKIPTPRVELFIMPNFCSFLFASQRTYNLFGQISDVPVYYYYQVAGNHLFE